MNHRFTREDMLSRALHLLALLAFVVLSGCAAVGPPFAAITPKDPANGIVYLYRPAQSSNSVIAPGITIGNQEYAVLPSGGYMSFELPVGTHMVGLLLGKRYTGQGRVSVNVEPERPAYLRLDTWNDSNGSTMTRRFKLSTQPASVAEAEIRECRQQDATGGPRFGNGSIWADD